MDAVCADGWFLDCNIKSFMVRSVSIFRILILLLMLPFAGVLQAQKAKQFTVVIDPGHGGHDPGAVNGKVLEKDINLKVSKMLSAEIKKAFPEVKVVLTRSTDVFIELHERSKIANKAKGDLLISIHSNAAKNKGSNGVETIMWGIPSTEDEKRLAIYENQVVALEKDKGAKYKKYESDEDYILKQLMFDQDVSLSAEIAQAVQDAMVKKTKLNDRGVKSSDLYVLRQTAMPRILVEIGFVSNQKERDYIASDAGQKKIVDGIFEGFSEYYRLYGKGQDTEGENGNDAAGESVPAKSEVKSGVPVFKVQLFAADTKLKDDDKRFKGLKVGSFKEGKWYKYTYGETEDYNRIQQIKKDVQSKFKDAFVVAFIDGKRVETSKAVEIFRKNQKKKK